MKKFVILLWIFCLLCSLFAGCQRTLPQQPQIMAAEREKMTAVPMEAGSDVLRSQRLRLQMGEDPNSLTLWDEKTQHSYTTAISPEEAETVKGVMRLKLQSLVTGSFYDLQLKKETDFYSANQEITATAQLLQGEEISILEMAFSLENGLSFKVEAEIQGETLILRIPKHSLVETERFVFKKLQLAPNFLSATAQQEGYFLLPDGSGTLMNFHNGKKGVYDEPVYGVNRAFVYEAYAVAEQNVHLPVIGMMRDGGTVLGVISQGAACSRIFAATNGNETSRNRAYPTFVLRQEDTQYITQDAFQTVIQQESNLVGDLEVTYLFGEDQGGYSQMAQLLRVYLLQQGMTVSMPEGCVLVSIYGAVEEKQKIFGVPLYDKAGQITSYEAAEQIIQEISSWTQTTPAVRLAAWNRSTVTGRSAGQLNIVGAEKQFSGLLDVCEETAIPVYLSERFATVRRGGQGISLKQDVIRNLANEPSQQYRYYRASNSANEELPRWYYLNGAAVQEQVQAFAQQAAQYDLTAVAVEDISSLSYANYRKNGQWGQDGTILAFTQSLESLQNSYSLMLQGGYWYSLPYGNFVYHAPDSDSQFVCTDLQVPFYQMVLSGVCAYALTPVNQQENRTAAFLQALETGAWIHYELAEETAYLQGTELEFLYGAKWSAAAELIRWELEKYEQDLSCVAGNTIVSHETLSENVKRTCYANGWTVTVNYRKEPVVIDGTTIEAESYRMERGMKNG